MSKETDRKEINRILHRMLASPFRAVLGDGGGTVNVAGKTGYVWARKLGREEIVFQAYNRSLPVANEGRVVLVQGSRIEGLTGYEVIGSAGGDITASTSSPSDNDCTVVRVDADEDGDFDPYVSTDWDGDSRATSTGTINWAVAFGVPAGAKMVFLAVTVRDSSAAESAGYISFYAKSTATIASLRVYSKPSDSLNTNNGWVPVASDGTSYFSAVASGGAGTTLDVWIRVSAYAK